jgi:hypothetical protein
MTSSPIKSKFPLKEDDILELDSSTESDSVDFSRSAIIIPLCPIIGS